ncbi:MAG: hypothetical protein HY331_02425 [Chloroflexi bacterium]|nr:hypothetical protein [Chloroflexota bacterium]
MTSAADLRSTLEEEAGSDNFRMSALMARIPAVLAGRVVWQNYERVSSTLGTADGRYVLQSLLRAAFLIELVKTPKIDSTKFEVRWTSRLATTDPRHASFVDCYHVFEELLSSLAIAVHDPKNCDLLRLFRARRSVAYEIPVDYRERRLAAPMHRSDNVYWMWDELPKRVVRLRAYLLDPAQNRYAQSFAMAYDKIRVKTYLTERVLTGAYKTNREKRWETHPASVHFALRRSCVEIEHTLLNQLCHFEGFPSDLQESLEAAGLLTRLPPPFRCPITMDPLSYTEFEREIHDPRHGKADFQVGHLNPLKALTDDPQAGHSAQNIGWVSSDGNRIQGSLSLRETQALIRRICQNYDLFGAD